MVENEQYFIILPIGYKAKPSRILSQDTHHNVVIVHVNAVRFLLAVIELTGYAESLDVPSS